LALVLAGAASAGGWRDLRVDGSSEEAFAKSLEAFKDKLSPARRYVYGEALKDIWLEGDKAARAAQREYTDDEYYARVDGLRYEEIVTLTDPTGDTAKDRYRAASMTQRYYASRASGASNPTWPPSSGPGSGYPPPVQSGVYRGDKVPNTADTRAACQCMDPGNSVPQP
jgi:hypothetical protein